MIERRFDIIYGEHGPRLDYHFCREWDADGGCYGTRDDHGFSFEDAKRSMAEHHRAMAETWECMTAEDFEKHGNPNVPAWQKTAAEAY